MAAPVLRQAVALESGFLADIRVAAMKQSLESVGRFDPMRARSRFLSSFQADETFVILHQSQRVGFFVLIKRVDHWRLDHLYILPTAQGLGLGTYVVSHVQKQAQAAEKPVRLVALKDSPANRFYLSHGFEATGSEGFDVAYAWNDAPDRLE